MPKNKVGFTIATYQGVRVDWPIIVADYLSVAIDSMKGGKKVWMAVAQWLTLLAPLVELVPTKKKGRTTETILNKPSKWQQLLAKQAPRWKE